MKLEMLYKKISWSQKLALETAVEGLRQFCFTFSRKITLGQRALAPVTAQNSNAGVFKNKIRAAKKP